MDTATGAGDLPPDRTIDKPTESTQEADFKAVDFPPYHFTYLNDKDEFALVQHLSISTLMLALYRSK